ncbi:MAG: L-seryl-tRNA(Sec) selenium transferase [Acidobacteria bacterium]|nr:MAG: L-seryl-tRNA(Sec) selenium transferase [Acidobacteriota bacterium]PYY07775.1 MAG: L-seryl-tRNA(Sec) selenium transferase [Acidobacteriota bacterium]
MKAIRRSDLYRKLPAIDALLRAPEVAALVAREGQVAVAEAARVVLARVRDEIAAGVLDSTRLELAIAGLPPAIERQLQQSLAYSLREVINGTGVILHTNLGRAPLSARALDHVRDVALGYSNLEFDIAAGARGKRDVHVDRLFRKLLSEQTGDVEADLPPAQSERSSAKQAAEISTIVVNNNAAAVLIALNTLAEGGEVIVSRGELVEIGGSFRIPDVMAKSNAILREVGTTNRTRIADYERAINDQTRLLLRVHRSNFQITGFTEQPSLTELTRLARKRSVPLMEDVGSGALFDLRSVGITGEPGVLGSLRAGVDVVTYSGDKLLGGPQAGILSGKRELIARIRANPLFRALRVDKLTYAALEATLLAYVKHDHDAIPALRMMRLSKQEIGARAEAMLEQLPSPRLSAHIIDGESVVGGGAAPSAALPTRLIALTVRALSADELAGRLRQSGVITRTEEGRVLLDLRTVFPEQDPAVAQVLRRALED